MKGLPLTWLHAADELYSNLRGPAKNVTVLATATAPASMAGGTGEHEPMIMTINYREGPRVSRHARPRRSEVRRNQSLP